jgi:hypothetical protein
MHKRQASRSVDLLSGFISSWLLLAGGYSGTVSEASCPTLSDTDGWTANGFVHYQPTGFTNQEMAQIGGGGGLGNWTGYNISPTQGNCSNVPFWAAPPLGQYSITTDSGIYSPDPASAAVTSIVAVNRIAISATTVFYWGALRLDSSPVWNRNGSSGYYSFVRKVMLHEAGHTMGLDHPPIQFSGQSVMNTYSGTNDSGNNIPTEVQPCDNNKVNSIPQYANNCSIGGGGGGGGGGGSEGTCAECERDDDCFECDLEAYCFIGQFYRPMRSLYTYSG